MKVQIFSVVIIFFNMGFVEEATQWWGGGLVNVFPLPAELN